MAILSCSINVDFQRMDITATAAQDWEEIPGIDDVIHRAESSLMAGQVSATLDLNLTNFISKSKSLKDSEDFLCLFEVFLKTSDMRKCFFWHASCHPACLLRGLETSKRELQDLFYGSQPPEMPWASWSERHDFLC